MNEYGRVLRGTPDVFHRSQLPFPLNTSKFRGGKVPTEKFFFALVNQVSKCIDVNRLQLQCQLIEIAAVPPTPLGEIQHQGQSQKSKNRKYQRNHHRCTIFCNSWFQSSMSCSCKPRPMKTGAFSGKNKYVIHTRTQTW